MSYSLNLKERGSEFISLDPEANFSLPAQDGDSLEFYDLIYRTLCAIMFNHASSGHPGGSISSGRIVESLIFNQMNYDISNPMDRTADIISYAAGHKALGLYAMWALRNEVVRQTNPDLLPEVIQQMRLEDLLAIHQKMYERVEALGGRIKDVTFCPHHPDDNCECRKPKPGLINTLSERYQLDLACGHYVGDSLKDLRAAEAAGCKAVLVLTGNGTATRQLRPDHEPVFTDLIAFAEALTSVKAV